MQPKPTIIAAFTRRFAQLGVAVVVVLLVVLLDQRAAHGQAAWEFSPYDVRIWITWPDDYLLPPRQQEETAEFLIRRADVVLAAVWRTEVSPPPGPIAPLMADDPSAVAIEQIHELAPKTLDADKLFLVSVTSAPGGYGIATRELDCRTRQWSETLHRSAAQREEIPLAIWDSLVDAFTPIVKIESVEGKKITGRIRSGGLIVDPKSPANVGLDAVLRPVIRRNDRTGEPLKNGIQTQEWTLVRVTGQDESQVSGDLVSGFRYAIPPKAGHRIERLALLVKPRWPSTRVMLQSRGKPPRPLAGYQIFGPVEGSDEPQLLGATDFDGGFELPRTDGRLQTLHVRSGTQLLARLPLVPGQAPQLVASITDDDGRLQAEGFVMAFHSRVMDLVARRELLAARFRARLEERKLDEAQRALEEFRILETRGDLSRSLDQQQQLITSSDRITQLRIERLFSDARKLLFKYFDPEDPNKMARELAAARAKK